MVTIITRRETGWFDSEGGQNTEKNIWEQICLAYEVDRLIMIPKFEETTLEQYDTIEEALDSVKGTKVFVEKKNRMEEIEREPVFLEDFKHPDEAVYIFGNGAIDNSRWIKDKDLILSIDTPKEAHMFGISIAPIILEDREVKDGS